MGINAFRSQSTDITNRNLVPIFNDYGGFPLGVSATLNDFFFMANLGGDFILRYQQGGIAEVLSSPDSPEPISALLGINDNLILCSSSGG